jgi:hypothetical protein
MGPHCQARNSANLHRTHPMRPTPRHFLAATCLLAPQLSLFLQAADDTVTTAVFSRVSKEYHRQRLTEGGFKPEYYAIANGGMVAGTSRDQTVERVTYPEIASLVMQQLLQQGYHYAKDTKEASLLLVLHWGNTLPFNTINFQQSLGPASQAMSALQQLKNSNATQSEIDRAQGDLDAMLDLVEMERLMRNSYVAPNARLLGYIEDINDSNDIRRLTSVGDDRYRDMMADVEESRYYVIISAYDFPELLKHGKQKLLWVTRVSVRSPGNSFDESVAAMLKNASHYFGRGSGKLVRGEELRGRVELGDLKFLGEATAQPATKTEARK